MHRSDSRLRIRILLSDIKLLERVNSLSNIILNISSFFCVK
nr:MAG TPA: hypothetical protein [Caudoviricetes sp.]